jgi:hypothetical protein
LKVEGLLIRRLSDTVRFQKKESARNTMKKSGFTETTGHLKILLMLENIRFSKFQKKVNWPSRKP